MTMKHIDTWLVHNITSILLIILLFMTMLRIGITYANPTGHLRMPEWNFAYSSLGRDSDMYPIQPVYGIRNKENPPYLFAGYGLTLIADTVLRALEASGICNPSDTHSCSLNWYHGSMFFSLGVFLFLLFTVIRRNDNRQIAILFFATFLLGVPMSKALEAGNMDLVLAPVVGILLLYIRGVTEHTNGNTIRYIMIGTIAALLVTSKVFLVIFTVFAILGICNFTTITSFSTAFLMMSLWPRFYGVHASILDIVTFALDATKYARTQIQTQINYGNNAVFSYVSGMLQTILPRNMPAAIRNNLRSVLTGGISLILYFLLLIRPWFDTFSLHKSRHNPICLSGVTTVHFSFRSILVAFTFGYICILIIPSWSFDFRLLYGLPIMYFLMNEADDNRSKSFLYLSIISLLLKSLWIYQERILTIFLYIHCYFLLRAALSVWKHQQVGYERIS